MTKSPGKEPASFDIAVNGVTPAVARTPGAVEQSPKHIKYMLAKIPRGRFLELHEGGDGRKLVHDRCGLRSVGRATY
jgi:3-oxoacyl-[acyl-carrier protein] reductase